MSEASINRYKNPRSNRKIKARAKRLAAEILNLGVFAKPVDKSAQFFQEEQANKPVERNEDTSFKKEKPLKQGNTAGGKQAVVRGSIPLI